MTRSSLAALVLASSACSTPAQQVPPTHPTVIPRSETMTPPAMPFACDLEAAPLGSWADYELKDPLARDPRTTRVALVGRGPDGSTIESTFDVSRRTDWVTALVFGRGQGAPGQLRKVTLQDGTFPPMDLPLPPDPRRSHYGTIDPRSLVGTEEITVPAGSFTAKRYHYLTPFGENVDAWINDTAWPICLIKLDAEQKQMPSWPGRVTYELVATGSDAKPQITRPAVPYDIEVLKKQDEEKRIRDHRPDSGPRVGDTIAP